MPATVELRQSSISTTGYVDGLGRRSIRFDRELATTLECLHVRPELRAYEDALLDQACAISDLGDARFMRVRSLDREHGRLVVISELAAGDRLSDIVEARAAGDVAISGIDAAFGFLLQILPALSRLHAASMVHGTLAPGRVILTHTGQVIVADPIFGTALPRLNLSRRCLWQELHVAFPADPTGDNRGPDVAQAALCSLIVALGRQIDADDPLNALPALIGGVVELAHARGGERLSTDVRGLFQALLPASGRRTELTAAQAVEQAGAIASRELGEDACARALVDFLRYDATDVPVAASASAPAPLIARPVRSELEGAPAPPAGPAAAKPPATAPVIALKSDPSAGYVPLRTMFGVVTADEEADSRVKALAFVHRGRALIEAAPFPWKVAAAAVMVVAVGIFAGRSYLHGDNGTATAAPPAAAPAPAAPPAPAAATATTGVLTIDTQPAGAKVLVDGAHAGQTPLRLDAVAPGRHTVTVITENGSAKRTIRVVAGKTAALDIPVFSGWVAIHAPIVLDVAEGSRRLGTTGQGRILLPPGRHTLTVSNRDLTYSSVHTVRIGAGEAAVLKVTPTGRVNLNAQPWAEVWIDGARAGETPLANLRVPLGTREFVFKHPQYGERKITATVSATPSALSVDFTKPSQRP